MAFTGITATEAEIDQKMGAGVDTNYTDVMKTAALLHAEGSLNATCRYNWSDYFVAGTPNTDVLGIITEVTASLVAIEGLKYNLLGLAGTGITRIETEDRINILRDTVLRNMSILRDKEVQKFMEGQSA